MVSLSQVHSVAAAAHLSQHVSRDTGGNDRVLDGSESLFEGSVLFQQISGQSGLKKPVGNELF